MKSLKDRLLYSEAQASALRSGATTAQAKEYADAFAKAKPGERKGMAFGKKAAPAKGKPGSNPVAARMEAMQKAKQGAKGGFGAK